MKFKKKTTQRPAAPQPIDELERMNIELKKIMALLVSIEGEMNVEQARSVLTSINRFHQEQLNPYLLHVAELRGSWTAVLEELQKRTQHLSMVQEPLRDGLQKMRLKDWQKANNGS